MKQTDAGRRPGVLPHAPTGIRSATVLRPPLILGYHGIANVDPPHDPIRLFVPPRKLERQIAWLRRFGYEFVTMSEFGERLTPEGPPPGLCALTFDDGTEDHATVLPPLLERLGVPGTVYVCPGLLGEPYSWVEPDSGARFMTDGELTTLAAQSHIEIGSHTIMHTKLADADAETAYREMADCKRILEERLDREIPSFCYPSCDYSPESPPAARRAGYRTAVTCRDQGSWDPLELKRESIHTPDGPVTFALKARGAYYRTRDRKPLRLARELTRPIRHRHERGS